MAHMTLPKSTYVSLAAVSLNFDHIHDLGAHAETQMSRRSCSTVTVPNEEVKPADMVRVAYGLNG